MFCYIIHATTPCIKLLIFLTFFPIHLTEINWGQYSDGITMILFQGDIDYATDHGVVKLGDKVVHV